MIAALYNVPADPTTLARFSFHNADAHTQAVVKIRSLSGLTLPEYPIDPINADDFKNWAYTHQAMHNSVNQTLGLAGNDLTDVDLTRLDQITVWIQLHAAEHRAWGDILGLG